MYSIKKARNIVRKARTINVKERHINAFVNELEQTIDRNIEEISKQGRCCYAFKSFGKSVDERKAEYDLLNRYGNRGYEVYAYNIEEEGKILQKYIIYWK